MSTMTMHYYFLPNEKFISYMPGAIYFEITHMLVDEISKRKKGLEVYPFKSHSN